MNRGERIAEIEKDLKDRRREHAEITDMVKGFEERKQALFRQIKTLENQLEQMKPKDLQVTDHVVLRYMERNHGIDVEGVRAMLKEKLQGATNMGQLKVDGFVIKGNAVVTYFPPKSQTGT